MPLFAKLWIGVMVGIASVAAARADEAGSGNQNESIRVLTYNVRYDNPADGRDAWEFRRQAVADAIERHADVAGLQEVRHSQRLDLERLLPDFAAYGVGREDGKLHDESVPIFFRKARFELLTSGTFWLSPTPSQVGGKGWDAALPRITSWAKLKDKRTDRTLLFASTHFDHLGKQARLESAKLLAKELPALADGLPIVLVGDLNTAPDSPPIAALAGAFRDARTLVRKPQGPTGTWNGFRQIDPEQRIDFIFVTPNLSVAAYHVLDPRTAANRFASDHLPVWAEMTLTPAK